MQRAVRRLAAIVAFAFAGQVHAFTWTALWWNPAESGWGVTITEQGNVIVLTFLVYGEDRLPHWYEAAAYPGSPPETGYPAWTGDMYESTGPFYGGPFNPATVTTRKVGTVTFSPATPGTATLKYSIDGVVVTKPIERQSFQPIRLVGVYRGGYRVTESNCAGYPVDEPGNNGNILVGITNMTSNSVTGSLTIGIGFNGGSCGKIVPGTYKQYGNIFEIANATCSTATWSSLSLTDLDVAFVEGMQGNTSMQGNVIAIGTDGCQARLSVSVERTAP
jgi:hypothetical protein